MKYVDTSAFLKFLVREQYSAAIVAAAAGSELWSSTLLAVEAHRAALRLGVPGDEVDVALARVHLVLPAATTFHLARSVGDSALRTLDAIHLATALEIGAEVECVLTYDQRLARAASTLGVAVDAPGMAAGWWHT